MAWIDFTCTMWVTRGYQLRHNWKYRNNLGLTHHVVPWGDAYVAIFIDEESQR